MDAQGFDRLATAVSESANRRPLQAGMHSAVCTRRRPRSPRVTIPLWSAAELLFLRSSGRGQLSDTLSVASARSASATRVRFGQNPAWRLAPVHTA
jgi:hypothetical protein